MSSLASTHVAGRPRSPTTTAEFHVGRTPGNKGLSYPADPPRVEEIVAVMRQAGDGAHGEANGASSGCRRGSSSLPIGPLFCVIDGPTRGRPWAAPAVRLQLRRLAAEAGVRGRLAPHQLRHAHAVEMAREGVPLNVIQRQLGHANLRVTTVYLQGIDSEEIVSAIQARRAPMMPPSAGVHP
jgi:integrase